MLVHGAPLVDRDDRFRSRGAVGQGTMELLCVAASSPWLNYEHRLVQRVARLSVWKFVLETAIETLAVAILPWRDWLGLWGDGEAFYQAGSSLLRKTACLRARLIRVSLERRLTLIRSRLFPER